MAALPILVRDGSPHQLLPLSLSPKSATNPDGYDEAWLQDLIQRCPELLPIQELEPGFGRLIPVAREVACGHGYIDNLFVTADGGIALVETKLWRNLEARRMVVAQALDYAAALARMDYETFERAALAGLLSRPRPSSLHALLADQAEVLDEPAFIQAISSNLRRGRMLVIAAGDGVRAEAEALADLLQSHAGARFTFALVAIELFRTGEGAILAVPRAVAKTVLIERGVVSITDDRVQVAPARPATNATGPALRTTLTEEAFLEAMALRDPRLPEAIPAFLARISAFGVEPEWRASLNLKWVGGPDGPVNLGYIRKDGGLATDMTSYKLGELARPYLQALADLAGGRLVEKAGSYPFVAAADGRSSVKIERLLPDHADGWALAMDGLVLALQDRAARDQPLPSST